MRLPSRRRLRSRGAAPLGATRSRGALRRFYARVFSSRKNLSARLLARRSSGKFSLAFAFALPVDSRPSHSGRMDILDASSTLSQTSIPGLPLWRRGKVRDVYDLGDRLLIVTTDRISAFDVVLPTPIPAKGPALTQLSLFWFNLLRDLVPTHVISAPRDHYPPEPH